MIFRGLVIFYKNSIFQIFNFLSFLSIFKNWIFCVFPGPDRIKNFLTTKVDFLWKVPFFGIFSRFSRPNCVLNFYFSQFWLLFSLRVKKKFAKIYFRGSPKGVIKFCKNFEFFAFFPVQTTFWIFLSRKKLVIFLFSGYFFVLSRNMVN